MQLFDVEEICPILPYWYNEVWAVEKLGFRWMSWVDVPVRGTPGYPKEQRVRQLLSPKQLENERWKAYLAEKEAREADGTEPLAYAYCSSGGGIEPPPDLVSAELAVDLSRCVHDRCGRVPHDIGIHLARIVRKHFAEALNQS